MQNEELHTSVGVRDGLIKENKVSLKSIRKLLRLNDTLNTFQVVNNFILKSIFVMFSLPARFTIFAVKGPGGWNKMGLFEKLISTAVSVNPFIWIIAIGRGLILTILYINKTSKFQKFKLFLFGKVD